MREILFRGKRLDNGEWVYGDVQHNYDHEPRCISDYCGSSPVDPSTVGQYTGLKDKNGKRIFEGDIVKGEHVLHENRTVFEVVYEGNIFRFRDKKEMCWHPEYTEDTEIMGNIHDNRLEDFGGG